jgi:hypothetical protein
VNKESFAGAFKKTVKRFVAVGKAWAGDTSGITHDNDGPKTAL